MNSKTQQNLHLKVWLVAGWMVAASMASYLWLFREPPRVSGSVNGVTPLHSPEGVPTEAQPANVSSSTSTLGGELSKEPQRWRSIARHTYLQLTQPGSFSISPAVIAILGLNPTQASDVNEAMGKFGDALRAEELRHASIDTNKGEEIIVAAFDRSPLLQKLRLDVAASLGSDVADYVAEQVSFDRELAAVNHEWRLIIDKGDGGWDTVTFSRHVQPRGTADAETPIRDGPFSISPTYESRSTYPVGTEVPWRLEHLFSSKDTLPRRE